jgi:hypothetical protein
MTLCLFFFVIAFSHAHNGTIFFSFCLYGKINHVFLKTGHLVIGLHSIACTKDCDHSLALVCTRGMFGYQVMTGGGHVYPNDKEKRLNEKKNSKVKLSWFIKGFPQKFLKAETKIKPKLNFEI